jgi:imidazolonepropionase-like amidohydrolase
MKYKQQTIRIRANLAWLFLLLCALSHDISAQWSGTTDDETVIIGGWLFTATTDERIPNPGIVIRDGKIDRVGPLPADFDSDLATVLELDPDATILPGMIDLHAHYNYDLVDQGRVEEVRYTGLVFLANGVTSTWSAGEFVPQRVLEQRRLIDTGEETGPRLFASGPYMGGFRCEYQVKTAEDDCIGWPNDISEAEIRAEIDYWADRGVVSIKIKQATPEETRVLIEQAQLRGMTTTGHLSNYHGEYDVDPREAIAMGLDRLEHNITLGNGGPRSSEMDEVIGLLIENEVYFDANLQMYGGINLRKELPGLVWTNESQYFTPYTQHLLEIRGAPSPESSPEEFGQRVVELQKLYGAGGAHLLIIGTDEPVYTSLLAGFAYHRELMAMVYAGISPSDVLKAATINGARALGVDDRLGSVETGKLADLVVVNGNPLEDIRTSRDIELVIKNGKAYRPGKLLDQARGKIGPSGPDDRADWVLRVPAFRD